jgi:hypothetical protein
VNLNPPHQQGYALNPSGVGYEGYGHGLSSVGEVQGSRGGAGLVGPRPQSPGVTGGGVSQVLPKWRGNPRPGSGGGGGGVGGAGVGRGAGLHLG